MLLWWNYRGDATHADDSAGDITDATFTKERVTVDVRPNRQYNLNNGEGRSRFHIEENGAVNITGTQDTHLVISSVHDNRTSSGHDVGFILQNHTGRWILNAEDNAGDNDGSLALYKHRMTETGTIDSEQTVALGILDNGFVGIRTRQNRIRCNR